MSVWFITGAFRGADQAASAVSAAVTRFGRIDSLVNELFVE
jgi:hypothetical protein